MIDGIKLSYLLRDVRQWKQATNLDFAFYVNEGTGEKIAKKRLKPDAAYATYISQTNFETYRLILRETHKKDSKGEAVVLNWLNIEGSLHKNHFGGANYQSFSWIALQNEIEHLKHSLHLNNESKIDNLEIGLNITMPFPVFPFLQRNLISYKGTSFREYEPDKNGIVLGYYCPCSQYELKIYDKGLQFDLPFHLMRVELRFTKMEILNRISISTLSDLQHYERVNNCSKLLLNAWKNVLLYDDRIDINNPAFTPFQRDLLLKGTDRTYWEILKKEKIRVFNDHRQKFRKLIQQYGNQSHSLIQNKLKDEWQALMQNDAIFPVNPKIGMYKLTDKVKCQNVHPKMCLSCGKDISDQHNSSKYCSEERLGKVGKKCRNMASNSRNNLKRKIESIKKKGVLFDITPYLKKKPA